MEGKSIKLHPQSLYLSMMSGFPTSKRRGILVFLAAAISAHAVPMVDSNTPAGVMPVSGGTAWQLDFSDEFSGTSLDTSKWGVDVSTSSRAARTDRGIADWWWKSANVSLDGAGNLKLDVTKQDSNTMWCGSVSSDGKYEPTYGYIEARIKIADTHKDTHTAFWLQGANQGNVDGTGNDGAEVDIFESAWFGDYTKSVVHIDGYGASHQANTKQYATTNLHTGYHVFGLDWTASSMKIYYDGVLKVTYTGSWVPQVQEWLWLSVGASFGDIGTFSTEPNGLLTSAYFDYVRVWKALPTYSVTYSGNGSNGGAVPTDSNGYPQGATVTVLGNAGNLTRTGYTFAGWNTSSNGSGTPYAPGATFAIGANDVALYAMWNAASTYTVSYNGNNKTSGTVPSNQTKTQGVNLTLATNSGNLARTGYAFAGWNTLANGNGSDYTAGGTYSADAAITLYAKWNALPAANAGTDQTVYLSAGQMWTPAAITPAAWYDAADATTLRADTAGTTQATTSVARWNDKSGNGLHLLQAASSLPSYSATGWDSSRPALSLNGTNDYLESASTLVQASTTMIAVYDQAGTDSLQRPFGVRNLSSGTSKKTFVFGADNSLRYEGDKSLGSIAASLGKHLRVASRTSNAQTDYVDGRVNINDTAALAANMDGCINVGNAAYGFVAPFSSKVAEAMLINGLISQAAREQLEGYLAHKWDLTANLPADHPYKTTAPTTSAAIANLDGTASDPEGAAITATWSMVSGPATATFANASAIDTAANFPMQGTYTLRLTISDGLGSASDDVVITVSQPTPYINWTGGSFAHAFTDTAFASNPDGDDLTNLQEFAFGMDPTSPALAPLSYVANGSLVAPGLPILENAGTSQSPLYRAVFVRRKDHATAGLTYTVHFCVDLGLWTASAATPALITSASAPGDYEVVGVPYPAMVPVAGGAPDRAPQFFRVETSAN